MSKGTTSGKARANWNDNLDVIFSDAVVKETLDGNVTQNGFTKVGWNNILKDFNEQSQCDYNMDQVRNRLNNLKSKYKVAKALTVLSGFGWDPTTCVFTASSAVWDEYLKAHPDAKCFKKSPFLVYDHMAFLCDGKVTEGKFRKSYHRQPNQERVSIDILEDTQEIRANGESLPLQDEPVIQREESVHSPDNERSVTKDANKGRETTNAKRKASNISELSEAVTELVEAHRFRASYFQSVDDPYGLNKCITTLEKLEGIEEEEIYDAIELFEKPHAREAFMSLKPHRRLNWLRRELSRPTMV
ncbi:hypothetical protein IFM89_021925 [Coptis chinensis]|uniref:Myb/SANT-like domain-containing protein n=1 Tax=Coptis chinensis TaxID=261450 RepID=A0A835HET7_9MAGN|nr:hypothetical protein IFM89_021925 [Coptis chinensis]